MAPGHRLVLLDGEDVYGPKVSPRRLRRRVGMVVQKPTRSHHVVYDTSRPAWLLQARPNPSWTRRGSTL